MRFPVESNILHIFNRNNNTPTARVEVAPPAVLAPNVEAAPTGDSELNEKVVAGSSPSLLHPTRKETETDPMAAVKTIPRQNTLHRQLDVQPKR